MKKPAFPWNAPKPWEYHLKYTHDFKDTGLPRDNFEGSGTDLNRNYTLDDVVTGCEGSVSDTIFTERTKHWDNDCSYLCSECEDEGCEECETDKEQKLLSGMSLQDLINMLPDGVELWDTSLSLKVDDWGGVVYGEFSLSYTKKLDTDHQITEYNKAVAEYTARFDKYMKEKIKYDKWEKGQKIAEIKAELAKLESQE
ncbi:hypothetical protein LCGC14_0469610 [marine sediment metagenome]|uniref:Uncharacterized protein n=1 Tax=marine sediment metagenome TaxID=412755 RepID=A0A0F9UZB8_9ZZZZ